MKNQPSPGAVRAAQMLNDYHHGWSTAKCAEVIEAETRCGELERCLRSLLYPNVPSGEDVAILIRMASGSHESSEKAMELAERLRIAQDEARALLASLEEKK